MDIIEYNKYDQLAVWEHSRQTASVKVFFTIFISDTCIMLTLL